MKHTPLNALKTTVFQSGGPVARNSAEFPGGNRNGYAFFSVNAGISSQKMPEATYTPSLPIFQAVLRYSANGMWR